MSSYKANRNGNNSSDSNLSEKERANKNNTNNVRNAADVAIASGNPYAAAAGGGMAGRLLADGCSVSRGNHRTAGTVSRV